MAYPGEKKGQRRGLWGHVMASFVIHDKCARCWEKRIGEDPCVKDKPCKICDGFTHKDIYLPHFLITSGKKNII